VFVGRKAPLLQKTGPSVLEWLKIVVTLSGRMPHYEEGFRDGKKVTGPPHVISMRTAEQELDAKDRSAKKAVGKEKREHLLGKVGISSRAFSEEEGISNHAEKREEPTAGERSPHKIAITSMAGIAGGERRGTLPTEWEKKGGCLLNTLFQNPIQDWLLGL